MDQFIEYDFNSYNSLSLVHQFMVQVFTFTIIVLSYSGLVLLPLDHWTKDQVLTMTLILIIPYL
jgi:hypothetical protein